MKKKYLNLEEIKNLPNDTKVYIINGSFVFDAFKGEEGLYDKVETIFYGVFENDLWFNWEQIKDEMKDGIKFYIEEK